MNRNSMILLMILLMIVTALYASGEAEEKPDVTSSASLPYKTVDLAGVTVDWVRERFEILFTIKAPTTGWVALGIDPSQKMRDAQYIIGYVTDSGELMLRDDFGIAPFAHKADVKMGGKDDVRVIDGFEKDGHVTISFAFPVNSPDLFDVVLTAEEVHTFLIAYGEDGADDFTSKHKKLGRVDVQF